MSEDTPITEIVDIENKGVYVLIKKDNYYIIQFIVAVVFLVLGFIIGKSL